MIIEQEVFKKLEVVEKRFSKPHHHLQLSQDGDCVCIERIGAKQLIKVLQEFVENDA